jgi:hypothetical protein
MAAKAYSRPMSSRSAGVGLWGQNANLSKSFIRLAEASDLFIGKKSSSL